MLLPASPRIVRMRRKVPRPRGIVITPRGMERFRAMQGPTPTRVSAPKPVTRRGRPVPQPPAAKARSTPGMSAYNHAPQAERP